MDSEKSMQEMVVRSTLNTFSTMLMIDLIHIKETPIEDVKCDFAGMIGFSGDYSGNIAICMTRATAMEAAANFVGEEVSSDTELSDCVGELVNMIAGNAKSSLSENTISLSLPEVVIGEDVKLDFCRYKTREDFYFESSSGLIKVIFTER